MGFLHDLGKYADQFQRRLCDPREPGRDHWTAPLELVPAVPRMVTPARTSLIRVALTRLFSTNMLTRSRSHFSF
jgi:hypothetical protein